MPILLILFIVASIFWEACSLWLLRRQVRSVRRHRDQVPADFAATVTPEEHRKAADYTVAKAKASAVSGLIGLALTLAYVLGLLDLIDGGLDTAFAPSVSHDVALVAAMSVVSFVVNLPLTIHSTFGVEQRFGFNRTTPRLFVLDLVRQAAVAAVIGLPLLYLLFWVMRTWSGLWWLYAWLGVLAIILAAPTVATRVVMPLFNKFEPLRDAALAARIEALLARCGFRSSGLFTMDASKRSSQGNAFFIGFGRTKRIVLFDTLLEKQTPIEVEAIVAHELGHFRHHHILFGLARGAAMALVVLAAIGWLTKQPWLLPSFGFSHRDPGIAFIVAVMLLGIVGPLTEPLSNWISRRHEFQADDYAREKVGAGPMVSALTRLSRDNASTLTPDPLYALVNYSHPPVPIRIAHLREEAGE